MKFLITPVLASSIAISTFAQTLDLGAADPTDYGDVSVVDAGRDENGSQWLGVKFDLNEGWKTYWEFPGQNGLAPYFDFGNAVNVAEIIYHWPEPHLIGEDGIESVGYSAAFTLPIEIIPIDAQVPTEVSLDITVGICDTICIPATLNYSGPLRQDLDLQGVQIQIAALDAFDNALCPEDFEGWALHVDVEETILTSEPDPELPADYLVNREGLCAINRVVDGEGLGDYATNIVPLEGGIDAAFDDDFEFELLDE